MSEIAHPKRSKNSVSKVVGKGIYTAVITLLRCRSVLCSYLAPKLAARQADRLFTTPQQGKQKSFRDVPPPQQTMISTAYGKLCCYRWPAPEQGGKPSSQPKVLLIHGWSGSPLQFQDVIKELVGQGCEVLTYDQPAHGRSEGKRASLPDFNAALQEILTQCGPFDVAIGHSLGATALAYTIAGGDQRVGKAILAAAPSDIERATKRFAHILWFSEPVRRMMQDRIEQRYGQLMSLFSVTYYGMKIKVPTLVVHDQSDKEVPFEDAQCMHREIAGSKLVKLSASGHQRMLKHPEFVRSVGQFMHTAA